MNRICKVLDIDLTSQTYMVYDIPVEMQNKYLGGAGINAKILLDEVDESVEPLSPANILIFGAGPLVGTKFPCTGRFTITTKSPITNIYADSNGGGFFGYRMSQAGFHHIILRGKSEEPTYLVIEKDKPLEFLNAGEVWGKDVVETDEILNTKHGPCETARIGIGGENLVLYANIASSRTRLSYHGRTGVGAVMGSKNLKAIVVKTAGLKSNVDDSQEFLELSKQYRETIKKSSGCEYRATNGTLNIMTAYNVFEDVWERNYQQWVPEETAKKLEPEAFLEKFYSGKKTGCWNCSMACSLHWEIKDGPRQGLAGGKVEFGHTFPLGANLGCFDFDQVLHLSEEANLLGVDSMELGFSMGFITECLQRGIVTKDEVGLDVQWGDGATYIQLARMIARRDGIGDILANGVRRAAHEIGRGSEAFAFHYKGQAYRAERNTPWILGFAVSARGGDHLKAMPFTNFAFGTPHAMGYMFGKSSDPREYDMKSPVAKGRYVWWHENYKTLSDCLGICIFPLINLFLVGEAQVGDLLEVFNTACGTSLTKEEFWLSSERVYQVMKLFNTMLGISRKDDKLPERHTDDAAECFPYHEIDLDNPGMLDEYYRYRGYSKDGLPTYDRLREVELDEVISRLEQMNLIKDESVPGVMELVTLK